LHKDTLLTREQCLYGLWKVCDEAKNLKSHLKRFMSYLREVNIVRSAMKAESLEQARALRNQEPSIYGSCDHSEDIHMSNCSPKSEIAESTKSTRKKICKIET
jgi:hypothetical protein